MTKDELIKFLKENLKIELDTNYYDDDDVMVKIYLKLGNDVISEESFWTKE